jgi:hypothetical protein
MCWIHEPDGYTVIATAFRPKDVPPARHHEADKHDRHGGQQQVRPDMPPEAIVARLALI